MRRWLPLVILAAAQFVMVLDSSVMNVSISQIVADLNTTVTGVQGAITMYTLVMAAFMLVGAKLGDIWGRDRAFGIGLAVYGLGSLTTALSPNLTVLLFGWSLVEGLGAVLVIPAIAALTAANYEGKDRAFAYGIIGGVAGAAIAVGPVIGGFVTTYYSWRYVFVGEVVIVIAVLLARKRMQAAPRPAHPPKLDFGGAALSALGLGLIVFGILQSSKWGWVWPLDAPTIDGHEITPLGFSLVPFLLTGGVLLLWCFGIWEERRTRLGLDALLDRTLLTIAALRAGLATLMSQQLVLMGTFFVLPDYLQVDLGFDAIETGKRLLPMSIAMLAAALTGPKLVTHLPPRAIVRIGLLAMSLAAFVMVGTIDVTLNETGFKVSLALFGVGAAGEDERGRRPPGHRPEPRRLPRDGADRLRSPHRPAHRLQRQDRPEPRPLGLDEDPDQRRDRERDRDRHGRAGARRRPRCRRHAGRGRRDHGRLQRCRARRPEEGDARSRAPRSRLDRLHAAAACQSRDSARARGRVLGLIRAARTGTLARWTRSSSTGS